MSGMQYTIRGVPEELDRRIRAEAQTTGKSINQVVLETLERAKLPAGPPYHDLDWFIDSGIADSGEEEALRWLDALPTDGPS